MEQSNYLTERLDAQIEWYDTKSQANLTNVGLSLLEPQK